MKIKTFGRVALPAVALLGGGLATSAWAAGDGGGNVQAAVVSNPEVKLGGILTGPNEVPGPGDPDGVGAATVTLNTATGQVCTVLETQDIDPLTMYHIHRGDATVAGPVVVNFSPAATDTESVAKCVAADPALVQEIAANPSGFYVNVHNAAFPNGAIRSQLSETPNTAGALTMLTEPVRVYDSRTDTANGQLAKDTSRVVDLTMAHDASGAMQMVLPPGSTGAIITLTVTQTGSGGFLRVFSNALIGQPDTSTINWTAAGSDIATTTTVAVDATGKIKVNAGGSGTHFIVDVVGYYSNLLGQQAG